ncbi:hypothetical protein TNCV_2374141 [Trichonephila clavipes]|nr:hypothetical protein TNCV_2374141 [Trichonephila clavipes]
MENGDLRGISLLGSVKIKNQECEAILLTLRLGKTRPLPGHSCIGSISAKNNFILVCLHPPQSPTREAACQSSGKNQAWGLPTVHPEYSATASGRGSNGSLIGLLPPSQESTFCMTAIGHLTRWAEATPLPDIKATTVADDFYLTWIARFDVPTTITTDQRCQFESSLFLALAKLLGE